MCKAQLVIVSLLTAAAPTALAAQERAVDGTLGAVAGAVALMNRGPSVQVPQTQDRSGSWAR